MREEISEETVTSRTRAGRRLRGMVAVAALVAMAGAGYHGVTHEVSGGAGAVAASSAGRMPGLDSGSGSGEGPNH
ncbi:hypothetical protein OG943_21375 [Amycolatopsis sp. NBC_00345]|uniref:hypothetical protein n=1 Tax=Amycolatopsis sp. NBC_00345 TaxID=2975955 RepID=UPI002E2581E1